MPNRAIKNATRGKAKAVSSNGKAVGSGQNVTNYDGTKNTNAGSYERRADNDSSPNGRVVTWKK